MSINKVTHQKRKDKKCCTAAKSFAQTERNVSTIVRAPFPPLQPRLVKEREEERRAEERRGGKGGGGGGGGERRKKATHSPVDILAAQAMKVPIQVFEKAVKRAKIRVEKRRVV